MFIETSDPGTGAGSAAPAGQDARTRDRVLRRVSERGPVTAAALADELGLTPAGVRRHLDTLLAAGHIDTAEASPGRRGRGRPARSFIVTADGHGRLSTRYDDVANSALEFLSRRFGADAVADFARDRLADLEARYAPIVDAAGDDLHARANALATALAADGYAASARPVELPGSEIADDGVPGVQLCQGHCPMHDVAARFPQFCEAETEVFARLLGVHVQRLATLAGGEHVCTTYAPGHPPARTTTRHGELHERPGPRPGGRVEPTDEPPPPDDSPLPDRPGSAPAHDERTPR